MNHPTYVHYSDDIESAAPDEAKIIEGITRAFDNVQEKITEKHNHGLRTVHSKSHGVLKGEMTINSDLPAEFRQGIFVPGHVYPVMVRLSTSPSDVMKDRVGGVRGVGLKVLGVTGSRQTSETPDATTQDFLMVNHPTFPAKDAGAFSVQAQLLDKVVSNIPEDVQSAQNAGARMAGNVARSMGMDPIGLAVGIAKANTHILGDTFWSGVPIRFGDYIAKISLAPVSENLKRFKDAIIDEAQDNAIRNAVVEFFADNSAEYDLRVQLCTDLKIMPVEDPSVRWPEEQSNFVTIAKIKFPSQNAYSNERETYAENVLSFNPWNCIDAHRPLGSIMRTRKAVYAASSKFRHSTNKAPRVEPTDIAQMPD